MTLIIFLIAILFPGAIDEADHDIHVSVWDIYAEDDFMEIVIKTFLDDLQRAVGLTPGEELPEDYTSSDEMITSYLKKSIRFMMNDEELRYEVEDISAAMDAVWITVVIPGVRFNPSQKMTIKCSFLTEVYGDQTNLLNFRLGKKVKSYTLTRKKQWISHKF